MIKENWEIENNWSSMHAFVTAATKMQPETSQAIELISLTNYHLQDERRFEELKG